MADLLVKSIPDGFKTSDLVQADLLCYYIATLNSGWWFPQTYIYDTSQFYELFYKMVSLKHFEKVKILFEVDTIIEFKKKLKSLKRSGVNNGNNAFGYPNSFNRVLPIYKIINVDDIGTQR